MSLVRGIIDRAAQDIEHAAINVHPLLKTERVVERLEVLADLESLPGQFVNDMAVDPRGHALPVGRNRKRAVHALVADDANLFALPVEPSERAIYTPARRCRRLSK